MSLMQFFQPISDQTRKRKVPDDFDEEMNEIDAANNITTIEITEVNGEALGTNEIAVETNETAAEDGETKEDALVVHSRSRLLQTLTVNNVTISRELEAGVRSSNVRERVQPQLNNQSIYQKHEWESMEIGSFTEMILREKENNAESVDRRDDRPIPNDKSLIITILQGRRCLYCTICKTHVHANKKHCRDHLLSGGNPGDTRGHIYNRNKIKFHQSTEDRLSTSLRNWISKNKSTQTFQNVNLENQLFRMNCVYNFMRAGISLRKIDKMGMWIKEGFKKKLTHSNHLGQYITPITEAEHESIKDLLQLCCNCSVLFDSTTRVDEVLCVVLRFVMDDFSIAHKLVSLRRYDSCKNSEQLVTEMHRVLHERYNIKPTQIISFHRDRAAANEKMMEIMNRFYVYSHDVRCMSHTLTHVGEHLKSTDNLVYNVISLLQSMLNQNGGANKPRIRWKQVFGCEWANPGNTRWWSKFELILFLQSNWDKFQTFIGACNDDDDIEEIVEYAGTNRQSVKLTGKRILALKAVVNHMFDKHYLKLEVDLISIVAKPLIDATYILEGNGPTSLVAFRVVTDCYYHLQDYKNISYDTVPDKLRSAIKKCRKAIKNEVPKEMRAELGELNKVLCARANIMISGAVTYFEHTIHDGKLQNSSSILQRDIRLFNFCKYFDPIDFRGSMNESNWNEFKDIFLSIWDINDNDGSMISSIFTKEELLKVREEWSRYRLQVLSININENDYNPKYRMNEAIKFWKNSTLYNIPTIAKFARYCFCIAASSGPAERVFSTLKSSLSLVQLRKCIEQYSEIAVMLQYNSIEDVKNVKWRDEEEIVISDSDND